MDVRNLTLKIPNGLFKKNRENVIKKFTSLNVKSGIILLVGANQQKLHCTDTEIPFAQESFFTYLFGATDLLDSFGCIDLKTNESTLFVPKKHPDYVIWEGIIHPPEYFSAKYGVNNCVFLTEMCEYLQKASPGEKLYVLKGINSDSRQKTRSATFDGIEKFDLDDQLLHKILVECRLFKSPEEIEVMKYACRIGAEAHCEMMKKVKPNMREFQLESIFRNHILSVGGCKLYAFNAICIGGKNTAILHRVSNDGVLKDGDLVLCDMGCKYNGYCSDITRCFPINGKFTKEQREIYDVVLNSQMKVLQMLKPGVNWVDCQFLALRMILEGLKDLGVVNGEIDKMMENEVAYYFMPHGVGHLLGLDTHDVGGFLNFDSQKRSKKKQLQYLRCVLKMDEGIIITVEPGCYFNAPLLARGFEDPKVSPFLVKEKIELYSKVGGVRIEDDVLITHDGCEVLTKGVPKTIEDIEKMME